MSTPTLKEKLNLIIETAEKNGITAYEIGKNTGLNVSGLQKLLAGKVERPRNTTLNIIQDYIEKKVFEEKRGQPLQQESSVVAEPSAQYDSSVSKDDYIKTLLQMIKRQEEMIEMLKQSNKEDR